MKFTRFTNGVVVVNIWNNDIVLKDMDGTKHVVYGNNLGFENDILEGMSGDPRFVFEQTEDFSVCQLRTFGTAGGRLKIDGIKNWFKTTFHEGKLVILGPAYVAKAYPGQIFYTFQNASCTRFYAY